MLDFHLSVQPKTEQQLDLSENSQPSHSKPSPHFLEIPQSI